jgi:hypothetical protein
VPQKTRFLGLGFYNPEPVTPDVRSNEYTGSFADRLVIGGGILESAFSFGHMGSKVWPQSDAPMVLAPNGHRGAYYLRQMRGAERWQWLETYSFTRGAHQFKTGATLIRTWARGDSQARPVEVRDFADTPLERIAFNGGGAFRLRDWESGLFFQDHWTVTPRFALDGGLRLDTQSLSRMWKVAPRVAAAYALSSASTARVGLGWFYDRVPLNVYAFESYPHREILRCPDFPGAWPEPAFCPGRTPASIFELRNVLGAVPDGQGFLIAGPRRPGNFAPRAITWNAQLEHRFSRLASVRGSYLTSRSAGLPVLDPQPDLGQMTLAGHGRSRYRQLEVVSRLSWAESQELFVTYTHSRSRGNLNEISNYLGTTPSPLIRPDAYAETYASVPHRVLAWGVIPMRYGVWMAPTVEYRIGFPFSALDARQQYAEPPHARRFPSFFSFDFRASKDIPYKKHVARISVSLFNVTNHWNPNTVRWNRADPQFGEFLGSRRRMFRVDFDLVN